MSVCTRTQVHTDLKRMLAITAASIVVACGGGGGSTGPAASPPPPPPAAPVPAPNTAQRAAPNANTPTSWSFCSKLFTGAGCTFEGRRLIRIGAGAQWVSKAFMDSFPGYLCNPSNFGNPTLPAGSTCEVSNLTETGTIAAPSSCYQGAMCPTVDLTKIPLGSPGDGALRVMATSQMPIQSSDGTGAFRVSCEFSHMSFDDPIVFPGQPGRAHLHAFFGNTGTDAFSTEQSLATTGNSTCHGGIANRSAYWVPALIDTRTGQPIVPTRPLWYYKSGYQGPRPQDINPMPSGLRMIAGDARTRTAQSPGVLTWNCFGVAGDYTSIPNCATGQSVEMRVFFPQCWDGRNLDSPDHKSHMAYGIGRVGNGCPATHPVAIPAITLNVTYLVRNANDPQYWKLSSDDPALPAGITGHADWFDGWSPTIRDEWINNCEKTGADCQADLLGNGRTLY